MKIFAKKNAKVGELFLYAPIGARFGGITPDMVREGLEQMGGADLDIYIDSDGGVVNEGVTIHNLIKRYAGHTRIIVDGIAASIASYILMAGKERIIGSNGRVMIHRAWGISAGFEEDFLQAAQNLHDVTETIADAYASVTGKSRPDIDAMMKAETWMKAEEALQNGFVQKVEQMHGQQLSPASYALLDKYENVPDELRARPNRTNAMLARMDMSIRAKNLRASPDKA